MNTDPKPTKDQLWRLIGDRLCYLQEGAEGLVKRTGLIRVGKENGKQYIDEYDLLASAKMDTKP